MPGPNAAFRSPIVATRGFGRDIASALVDGRQGWVDVAVIRHLGLKAGLGLGRPADPHARH